MNERFVAIGDVHGRYDLLSGLIQKVRDQGPAPFRFVFLGDLVDRGPDSFRVVATVKALTETEDALCLLGNHEDMMLNYARKGVVDRNDLWIYNGGGRTIDSYGRETKRYGIGQFFQAFAESGHEAWMRRLPLYHETADVWFSHAPVPKDKYRGHFGNPRVDFRDDKMKLIWSFHGESTAKDEADFARDHGKLAVCGHVHAIEDRIFIPRIYPNIAYVDTGSGCWNAAPLSAVVIQDGRLVKTLQCHPEEVSDTAARMRDIIPCWSTQAE